MTRILIAEDDADLRLLLRLVLHRAGHQVSEARDGVEALEAISRETFDVVLLDNLMPRMSGIEVLEAVQLLRRVERPLILVISALATRADIRSAKPLSQTGLNTLSQCNVLEWRYPLTGLVIDHRP